MEKPKPPRALEPSFLPPGTEVGGYRVEHLWGLGSYGLVYRAHRIGEEELKVALKVARSAEDARFEREVQLLARTSHPSIPRLCGHGVWEHPEGRFPFLAMEWVEGKPLYTAARRQGLGSLQVASWVAQVASALAAVHSAGGLHRDVKGDNVLVRAEDGRAMVLDFGSGDYEGALPLTQEVLPPGTLPYRSPEALSFQRYHWGDSQKHYQPCAADDVYALGVTAWRLLTGQYPVRGEPDSSEQAAPAPPPRVPLQALVTVPAELAVWVERMLAEEPSARPGAARVAEALERLVESWGDEEDSPILSLPALAAQVEPERKPASREPRARVRGWRRCAGAAAGVVGLLVLSHWAWPVGLGWLQAQRSGGGEEAGTSGLCTEVAAVSMSVKAPEPHGKALHAQVPKQPLPGQARPPCMQLEVEIHGGCWVLSPGVLPPCPGRNHEWQGLCYHAALALTAPATSKEPD